MADDVTATAFAREEGLDDWRYLLDRIHATFRAPSPGGAAAFAARVVEAGDQAGIVPDVDLRQTVVQVVVGSGGLGPAGLDLARRVSALASEGGLAVEPGVARLAEVAIDAVDIAAVKPFWMAAFGYVDDGPQAIVDPLRLGPPVWFQQMDAVRPERNHIHIDITVPHDIAEQRVADVVAAGGVIRDVHKRSFTVLADPEGNEACICTCLDRD
jgi:4a-hydroxytetrahydrobiopterin dehydratase